MSTNGLDASSKNGLGPFRPSTRHRLTRSITEVGSLPAGMLFFSGTQSQHQMPQLYHGRQSRNDDRQVQSVYSTARSGRASLDLPRSEGVTPNMTPNVSRRTSLLLAGGDDGRVFAATSPPSKAVSVKMSMANMLEERKKSDCRTAGLQKSLLDLGAFSTSTAQRLDDAYYSLLEKTVAVQSMLLALKDVAELARGVTPAFERDAASLVRDVCEQLDARGGFEAQKARIESLQGRIQGGRGRIEELSGRVDAVRETIEGWERRDQEWRNQTRRRLKIVWMAMVAAVVLVLSLFLAATYVLEPGLAGKQIGSPSSRPSLGLDLGTKHGRTNPKDDPLQILENL